MTTVEALKWALDQLGAPKTDESGQRLNLPRRVAAARALGTITDRVLKAPAGCADEKESHKVNGFCLHCCDGWL